MKRSRSSSIGYRKSGAEEIAEMIAMADADGSGSIDFAEFVTLMAHNMAGSEKTEESIAAAFSVFDTDGGGSISQLELQRILMNVGEPITTEDVEAVIKKIDQDFHIILSTKHG